MGLVLAMPRGLTGTATGVLKLRFIAINATSDLSNAVPPPAVHDARLSHVRGAHSPTLLPPRRFSTVPPALRPLQAARVHSRKDFWRSGMGGKPKSPARK
jgi:hypothetical protein